MFKKTFLAVAVGAALGSTGAVAAELTPRATSTWSDEAANGVTEFLIPNVTVTLKKEYTPNDLMTLTYTNEGADVDWPEVLNVDDRGLMPGDEGAFTMTFGLLEDNGTSALYRVTELTSAAGGAASAITTVDATFVIDSEGEGWTSPGATALTMSATTSTGAPLEAEASSGDMITFDEQFDMVIDDGTGFSETIDVERGVGEDYYRDTTISGGYYTGGEDFIALGEDLRFGGNVEDSVYWGYENAPSRAIFTTNDGEDSASVMLSNDADSEAAHLATVTGVEVKLTGPLGFLVDEDEETDGIQNDAFVATLAGDGGIDGERQVEGTIDGDTITFSFAYDGTDIDNEVGFHFDNARNGDGDNDMYAGSFSATAKLTYAPADPAYRGVDDTAVTNGYATIERDPADMENAGGTADVGAWDMDGSDVMVYAMPVTSPAQGFIWVTVSGQDDDATTEITGVAIGEDGMERVIATTSIEGNGIVKLTNNLYGDMIAAEVPDNSRANIRVTTTAPACDVNVSATYKVDGDRLTLETSQTINGVHNTGNTGLADDLCILD